ncbi:MAG: cytochrome c-type biogenesis CcmF C-terminal domain-containing protein, partial [bacterium]|nr:cytochrome c-type biogenesis CcmF C-terminal domain-containing protein [bacterium]
EGRQAPQRFEIRAIVEVSKNGKFLTTLAPQMNYYPQSNQPIGSPAVRSTLLEDLYLTLISFEEDGSRASIHAIVTPAVAWIWIGGVVVMLGGFLSIFSDKKKPL